MPRGRSDPAALILSFLRKRPPHDQARDLDPAGCDLGLVLHDLSGVQPPPPGPAQDSPVQEDIPTRSVHNEPVAHPAVKPLHHSPLHARRPPSTSATFG